MTYSKSARLRCDRIIEAILGAREESHLDFANSLQH